MLRISLFALKSWNSFKIKKITLVLKVFNIAYSIELVNTLSRFVIYLGVNPFRWSDKFITEKNVKLESL